MYYLDPDNYFHDELDNREVVVSIKCITYNHEAFIRNALDGFVMQKTDFRFEVIIHDDNSTDTTATIIREYAKKYPSIVKPIFETENQYSKKNDSLSEIVNRHIRGKYVALCEGDDYWTDPFKLQKQVGFLDSHPDYSMCFHNAIEHWEDGRIPDQLFAPLEQRDYKYYELGAEWNVPTASAVIRREVFESDLYKRAIGCKKFIYGDVLVWLSAIEIGKVYCSTEVMSVYRRHAGGITLIQSPQQDKKIIYHSQAIPIVFGEKYKFTAIDTTVNLGIDRFVNLLKKSQYKMALEFLFISFKYAPVRTCKKLAPILFAQLKKCSKYIPKI